MKKVVIFRNGSIGNTLVAVPLIRAVKESTGAYVAVVVDSTGFELLNGLSFIDELIVYEKSSNDKGIIGAIKLIAKLRREKFDTAILVKRFFRNELIVKLAGIPQRVGYKSPKVEPYKLTKTVPYIPGRNIVDLNLDLLKPLGLSIANDSLEMAISKEESQKALELLNGIKPKSYVVCHLGGSNKYGGKWPIERYAQMLAHISDTTGAKIVIVAAGSEKEYVESILALLPAGYESKVLKLAGLPIRLMAAVIAHGKVFFGNDSGPSHIADAFAIPSVILYSKPDGVEEQVEEWKPKGEAFVAVFSPLGDMRHIPLQDAQKAFDALWARYGA